MSVEHTAEFDQDRHTALLHVLEFTSTRAAKYVTWATAILGMAALVPGLQLPAALGAIAGSIGIEAMGSLLDRIAYGDQISEEELLLQVKKAVEASGIDKALEKDDFYHAFAHLRRGQRSLSTQNQAIFDLLLSIEKLLSKEATIIPIETEWQESYRSWMESLLTLNPFPLLSSLA